MEMVIPTSLVFVTSLLVLGLVGTVIMLISQINTPRKLQIVDGKHYIKQLTTLIRVLDSSYKELESRGVFIKEAAKALDNYKVAILDLYSDFIITEQDEKALMEVKKLT